MLCDLTANNWGDNLVFFPCRWSHYHAKFSLYDEIGRSKSGLPSRPTKLPWIRRTSATVKRATYKKIEKNNSTPKRVLKTQATHRPKSKFHMRKLNHTFSFKPVAHRGAPQGYSTSLAPWKSSIYVQITLLFKRWVCKFITLVTRISFGIFLQLISLRSHSFHHWNKHLLAEFLHNKTDKSNNKKINITPLAKQ